MRRSPTEWIRSIDAAARRSRPLLTLALAAFVVLPPPAASQVLYGSITGNVSDQTGAALAGAKVAVTNSETGVVKTTTTDERGAYLADRPSAGSVRRHHGGGRLQAAQPKGRPVIQQRGAARRRPARIVGRHRDDRGNRRDRSAADGSRRHPYHPDLTSGQRAAADWQCGPELPEHHDARSRRADGRRAELCSRQPSAIDFVQRERRLAPAEQHETRRRQHRLPVATDEHGVRAFERGHRGNQHRHQLVQRRAGHGRWRLDQRRHQIGHEQFSRGGDGLTTRTTTGARGIFFSRRRRRSRTATWISSVATSADRS